VGRFKALEDAAASVVHRLRPLFEVYAVGAQRGTLHLEVPVDEVARAEAHFEAEPVELADGTRVTVRVEGRRGRGWVTYPVNGLAKHPRAA
jgi:hypothetical protein